MFRDARRRRHRRRRRRRRRCRRRRRFQCILIMRPIYPAQPLRPGRRRRAITAIHQIEGFRNLLRSKLKTRSGGIIRRKNLPARRESRHSHVAFPVDTPAGSALIIISVPRSANLVTGDSMFRSHEWHSNNNIINQFLSLPTQK